MLRVSVLELPARWAQPEDAFDDVDALLSDARATDLAIVPEMALVGYVSPDGDFDLSRFAEPMAGPTVQRAAELSRRHRTHLVVPIVLDENDELYNAAVVVGPRGDVVATYRKRHPWLPERWATPGTLPAPLFAIGDVRVTLAICYDGHFLAEDTADVLSRADLLVFTSAWVDEEDSRLPLLRDLSLRFGIAIANANWARGVVVVPGQGGSCILDAEARVLASVPDPDVSVTRPIRSARRADAIVHPRPKSGGRR